MDKLEQALAKVGDLNFKRRIKQIINYLNPTAKDKILDCGCGEGFYGYLINSLYGSEVVGLDYDQKMLDEAKAKISGSEKISFIQGNIYQLPFPDNYFDSVIFSEVLEHLDNEKKALGEIFRVVKHGGKVAVTVPNLDYPFLWDPLNWLRSFFRLGHFNPKSRTLGGVWSYDHKRLYSSESLEKIVIDSGFEVKQKVGMTHFTFPFNLLLLYLGKQLINLLSKQSAGDFEKFDLTHGGPKNKFLSFLFKLAQKHDSRNESRDFLKEKKSFITIFLGLRKTNAE